jgi:hypothetical protein
LLLGPSSVASSSHRISSQWSISRISPPASFSSISTRMSSRRAPPPPPNSKSRRARHTRIPVTQIIIPESESGQDPFSDFHSSSSSDHFDPTASIRHSFKPPHIPSTRILELQSIPCTEERCKLVAGKILNRGGRSMRNSRSLSCRSGYVRSSLSNVVVIDGDD